MSPLLDTPPPRTRRTREELRAETRARLLGAGWALFKEKGYHDLTAEEITARAGYSTSPLYTMFGSKERLFIELYVELTRRVEERSRDFGPLGISMREAMHGYIAIIERALSDEEYLAQLSLGVVISTLAPEAHEDMTWGHDIVRNHRVSMAAAVTRYAEAAGESLPLPAHRLADLLMASASGLLIRATDPAERELTVLHDLIDLLFPATAPAPTG